MESVQHMFDHIEGRVNEAGRTFVPVIAGVESLASPKLEHGVIKGEPSTSGKIEESSETQQETVRKSSTNSSKNHSSNTDTPALQSANANTENREMIPDSLNVNIIDNNIVISEDNPVDIQVQNTIPGQVIYQETRSDDADNNIKNIQGGINNISQGSIKCDAVDKESPSKRIKRNANEGSSHVAKQSDKSDAKNRFAETDESGGLKCRPCDQAVTSHIELWVHIEKRHTCRFCATRYDNMVTHIQDKSSSCHTHYQKPESCDVCGFTAQTIHELILHKATHYDSKHISHASICFLCNVDLGSALSLNSHITNDHKCAHCNAYAPNLDWHLIADHGNKESITTPGTVSIEKALGLTKEKAGNISMEHSSSISTSQGDSSGEMAIKSPHTNICDICGFKVKAPGKDALNNHKKIHFKKPPPALAVLEELKRLEKLKRERDRRKSGAGVKAGASDGGADCIVIGEDDDEVL